MFATLIHSIRLQPEELPSPQASVTAAQDITPALEPNPTAGMSTEDAASPSPTLTQLPTDPVEQLRLLDEDPDAVARLFGLEPDLAGTVSVPLAEMLQMVVATALAILLLRTIYRGMQHPRLKLHWHEAGPPTTTLKAIAAYLVTPILLIPLWYLAILVILVIAANRGSQLRPAEELILVAGLIVGASRLLAHVNLDAAHELAKSVPLTLISLILISGQTISVIGAVVLVNALAASGAWMLNMILFLMVSDIVLTTLWFFYRRVRWQVPVIDPAAQVSWLRRAFRRLAGWWAGSSTGASARQVPPSPGAIAEATAAGVGGHESSPDAPSAHGTPSSPNAPSNHGTPSTPGAPGTNGMSATEIAESLAQARQPGQPDTDHGH